MRAGGRVRAGAVVVAYGAPELLRAALAPLDGLDVVVVDNSSLAAVQAVCAATGARYVDPGSNLGFAAAANAGVRELWRATGERDVLLLNPDAELAAADVDRLQAALLAEPRTAAVAPCLDGPDGEQRATWPWPEPRRMWREALGLLGDDRHRGDWLVGAALMVSAQAYREVGGFDERFFLYAEETDWQRRAVAQGWRVRLVPEVRAAHVGAGTSDDPVRREALFQAAAETYVRKWFGARGWASYRSAALTGALLRSPLPGRRGAAARRRAVLYARGPRRAAGFDT